MIVLDSTRILRVTHASVLTTKPSWVVAWADSTSSALTETPGVFLETLSANTSETLVASPGSGARLIRDVWGRNNDAIADVFVIDVYDGSFAYTIFKGTLNSGDQIHIGDKIEVMDSNGNLKFTTGFANQSANTVMAGPTSGSAAQPAFRALVNADIPTTLTNVVRHEGAAGSGSNAIGTDMQIAGGAATGNAEPGVLALKYYLKHGSDSVVQTLSTQKFPLAACMLATTATKSPTSGDANATTTGVTMVSGTAVGTQTVEAGLLRVGRKIRVKAIGQYTSSGTPPTITINGYFGAVSVGNSGAFTPYTSITSKTFTVDLELVCTAVGASGTIIADGTVTIGSNSTSNSYTMYQTSTVDTTASTTLDLVVKWSANTAGNSLFISQTTFEILN